MIAPNSRYAVSSIVNVTKPNGKVVSVITPSDAISYTFTFINHIVTGEDRIDNLADAYYGDATLWWRIADGNPEILKWDSLTAGTLIRIPNI